MLQDNKVNPELHEMCQSVIASDTLFAFEAAFWPVVWFVLLRWRFRIGHLGNENLFCCKPYSLLSRKCWNARN